MTKKASRLFIIMSTFLACTQQTPKEDKTAESAWPHGVTYEIFVQSFYDTNGDGIGDLNGVTEKLDYLVDLGIEAIWLMPINPSPSYHKYDVTDYYDIHPDYGTMEDFKKLVDEAHSRNISVLIDLVINHCSSEHPWFKEAVASPTGKYRDFFSWATDAEIEKLGNATKEVTEDSDNINQWNAVPGQEEKFFAYFWGGMPDLNYDNQNVREEIFKIGKFWLRETNVDGFRLDAAKHIYPDNRPTDNHAFWIQFRKEMESVKSDVHLVGEVWDKAEVVAPYLAGLRSNFNFDLGDAIVKAVRKSDATGLVENYRVINDFYKAITEDFVDATFIRNHDQNRIMSILENHENKAKLAASILFTLPGSPYVYYGEEIGMRGMKPDEFIREPFLWSPDGKGQTTWITPKYSVADSIDHLTKQQGDPNSMYNHYKNLINLRSRHEVLSQGAIEPITNGTTSLCSFTRNLNGTSLEIHHNLSDESVTIKSGRENILYQSGKVMLEGDKIILNGFASVVLN